MIRVSIGAEVEGRSLCPVRERASQFSLNHLPTEIRETSVNSKIHEPSACEGMLSWHVTQVQRSSPFRKGLATRFMERAPGCMWMTQLPLACDGDTNLKAEKHPRVNFSQGPTPLVATWLIAQGPESNSPFWPSVEGWNTRIWALRTQCTHPFCQR